MAYMVSNRGLKRGLVSDLDSIMDEVFGSYNGNSVVPAVDIKASEDGYVVEAEIPGLSREDVAVRVEDDLLILESKAQEKDAKDEDRQESVRYLRRERRRGGFRRSFALPRDVDGTKIEATYTNGVLVLSLPKRAEAKPRTIQIQGS